MDTQDRINLGQAKNQASDMLRDLFFKIPEQDRETIYIKLVEFFYSTNKKIDLKTEGEGSSNSSLTPQLKTNDSKPSPYPKQKYCPKCNVIIPKTWKKHIECGWKE